MDPNRRFSDRDLASCLKLGTDKFGWSERSPKPGQVRQGNWMVGIGMAAAFRNNLVLKSGARVRLDGKGVITVETDMTDIGTGSYTIIAQTAAEMMGVTLDNVVVRLAIPTSRSRRGRADSSARIRRHTVSTRPASSCATQLRSISASTRFADGQVRAGNRAVALADAAASGPLVAEDSIEFAGFDKAYQQSTFGGHFGKVGVDAYTTEIRVRRMLAVCAAGRILNPKSARSQVIGAMMMGVGAALMEELAADTGRGFFVNHELAGYEMPVQR